WQATVRVARSAVDQAEGIFQAGAGTVELAQWVAESKAAVETAEADSQLRAELDRIRLEQAAVKEGTYDFAGAVAQYAQALQAYGIDVISPEQAAARVRSSRLRDALLVALR